jgi:CubicO group peptidase (beta-lactamase class C family)
MLDWNRMTEALAAQTPWWAPGTGNGYHVATFGYLVAELVRLVAGVNLGTRPREAIAEPLDAPRKHRPGGHRTWPGRRIPWAEHRLGQRGSA